MPLNSPLSRRRFLGASAAIAATAACASPTNAIAEPNSSAEPNASTPPAIAALPVLSGLARPFTNDERLARIVRAQRLMHQSKIDAIVLANSTTSSVYFADLRLNGGERLWALVLPAKAKPFLVCPAFEEGRARELLEAGPFGKDADVLVWQEDESPYVALGKGLAERGLTSATIGLDENMKFVFSEGIRAANPHLTIVSASPVTAGCRMIKDAHEIECLRLACRATLLVYRAVAQSLESGMTTANVHALVAAAYKRLASRARPASTSTSSRRCRTARASSRRCAKAPS